MSGEASPQTVRLSATVGGVATAGNDDSFSVGRSPVAGTVSGVSYIPEAASTGDNTNKRTYTLVNKGQAGAGTTVIATLDLVTSNNLVAFDEKAFTLSVVSGALTVAEGDILAFASTHVGTGLVDPGGRVEISITRTAGS